LPHIRYPKEDMQSAYKTRTIGGASMAALSIGALYSLIALFAYGVRIAVLPLWIPLLLGLRAKPCEMILGWLPSLSGVMSCVSVLASIGTFVRSPKGARNAVWQIIMPLLLFVAGSLLVYSQLILDSQISDICRSAYLWGATTAP
jgi:hypothetical protein